MHHLPRERLFGGLRSLGVTLEESPKTERAVRAECAAMASYAYTEEPPLPIPITAFLGDRDFWIPPGGLPAWRRHTAATFVLHGCPGAHDLLDDDPPELLEVVRQALRQRPFR